MFIQTATRSDALEMDFDPGRAVLASGERRFDEPTAAAVSPLAERLFQIDGIARVILTESVVRVRKAETADWTQLKAPILGVIMEHFVSGRPVVNEAMSSETASASAPDADEDTDPLAAELRELIDTRIRPAVQPSGGDVRFRGYEAGTVYLELGGSAHSFKDRIEGMLRHYVPEVTAVREYLDVSARPGLGTPTGLAVRRVLDESINPSVAAHGGHISLVDVQEDTVYIRLEGGCQGCGMADVTLKQGVEVEIRRAVPAVAAVLDVTDHADGTNPYYQQGEGGASPS